MSNKKARKERRLAARMALNKHGGEPIDAPLVEQVLTGEPVSPAPKSSRNMTMEYQSYSGPIPPPALLKQFNEINPKFGEVILTQFEEQGRHRRWSEKWVIVSNVLGSFGGQVLGFLLVGGTIAMGGWLIYNDKDVGGLGAIITAISGAAYSLLKAHKSRQAELVSKREGASKRK